MNTRSTRWTTFALLGALSLPTARALAQEDDNAPPPPPRPADARDDNGSRPDQPPPPPRRDDRNDGPRDRDDRRPPRDDRGPRPPAPPVPPVAGAASPQVHAMMGYLALVDQYKKLTSDPTAAGVAAVVTAGDVLRPRGPQAAAEYFEQLLPKVTNVAVRDAIRLQLADFYRASNNPDKALEHLSALMTVNLIGQDNAPANEPPKKPD